MDEGTFAGRVKRYASVSTKLSQLAIKLAKYHYLEEEDKAGKRATELKDALGDLKGPLMKIAQLLSTVPDLLPPEFASELMQLQSLSPPMGWPFVRRRMAAELGTNWQSRFQEFDREASAAASLGQVHKATSLDGDQLACKLQYPDMQSVVKADLSQLKLFFKVMDSYGKALKSDEIYKEIESRLLEELDYRLEAKHIALYQHIHRDASYVHIPEVYQDLSTDRLLTMNWLEGRKILELKDAPLEERNAVARNLFHAWYKPFYHYGVLHGDPHLGNYTVRDDLTVNLLDFGCIRVFPASFVQGVIDLYEALRDKREDQAVEAYKKWGFQEISKELVEVLNLWAKFLYAPLLEDRVRPIDESKSGVYGKEMASQVHEALRRIGGVTPPKEFVFMDRAAIGLGSVFLHLSAELNWHNEFHQIIRGLSQTQIDSNKTNAFKSVGL